MTTSRIIIEFADRPHYDVRIGAGVMASLGADLRSRGVQAARAALVCDLESRRRLGSLLQASLGDAGFRLADITVPPLDPIDVWTSIAELHRAFTALDLPEEAPLVVCAGIQATGIVSFAASSYGKRHPLVLAPASLACVFHGVAVDSFELDAGVGVPLRISAAPALASVDCEALACESAEEARLGIDELAQAASLCDGDFRAWHAEHADKIASFDADSLTLALTQTLATRADMLGRSIAARIAG